MRFTKMQACGNDFIVVNGFETTIADPGAFAAKYCDRHFGVGADGVLIVCPSSKADFRMRIINADGGEVNMCGNGIRCAAKYAYDRGICHKLEADIETGAGILRVCLDTDEADRCVSVKVDMGIPDIRPEKFPLDSDRNTVTIHCDEKDLHFYCVNTGVPHAVTFDLLPDDEQLSRIGNMVEHHPLFPARTNVCFGRIDSSEKVTAKVWERGCGPTLACGTGSCALLYAGYALGLLADHALISLPGGVLDDALCQNGHIKMTGPACDVFEGEVI